jgi:hypothetical protein
MFIAPVTYMLRRTRHVQKQGIEDSVKNTETYMPVPTAHVYKAVGHHNTIKYNIYPNAR